VVVDENISSGIERHVLGPLKKPTQPVEWGCGCIRKASLWRPRCYRFYLAIAQLSGRLQNPYLRVSASSGLGIIKSRIRLSRSWQAPMN
jgi:hypothetical protein